MVAPMRIFIISVLVMLAACHSPSIIVGNTRIDDPAMRDRLHVGLSEKRDVYLSYGQPEAVLYSSDQSGRSIWVYSRQVETAASVNSVPFLNLIAAGYDINSKYLQAIFNGEGKLLEIATNEDTGFVNQFSFAAGGGKPEFEVDGAVTVQSEMERYKLPYQPPIVYR